MATKYKVEVPPTVWADDVLESTEEIIIRVKPDGEKTIFSHRKIEKALPDGTPITNEGPPPGPLAAGRNVERNFEAVKAELITAMGVTLPVGIIGALISAAISKWAEEDRANAQPPSPLPET